MPLPYFDPCVVAQQEYDETAKGHWSQDLDRLARWMWNNGCTSQLQAMGLMPSSDNWAAPDHWPVGSDVIPGDPDDRQPPTVGN